MNYKIAVLPGDGIGQEIIPQGVRVLDAISKKYGHQFSYTEGLIGGAAIDVEGHPLPSKTIELCKSSDAVLLGAVGGPKWDNLPVELRPEAGALLGLRKGLGLYANIRPCHLFESLADASTLKREVIKGVDCVVIRELTGGLYFGEKKREKTLTGEIASDNLVYTTEEIERIITLAFETARNRKKKVCSVDKHNILESSRLWRDVAEQVGKRYPDVELSNMYVDNCAMQLIRNPRQFDVIVTENMFGDILTDEASMLTGSIGMLPSASIGGNVALFEPSHGSAPDIAGQNKANPLATILSVAMMLEYSFHLIEEAREIEQAVVQVLDQGYRTGDIMEVGKILVNTDMMTDKVLAAING